MAEILVGFIAIVVAILLMGAVLFGLMLLAGRLLKL